MKQIKRDKMSNDKENQYGEVFESSTENGIAVKLGSNNIESVKLGTPVLIETDRFIYYCVVVAIASTVNNNITNMLNTELESAFMKEYSQFSVGMLNAMHLQCLRKIDRATGNIFPPETIPPLFSKSTKMRHDVYEKIYKFNEHSVIGNLRDFKEFPISIDLDLLTETSFGLFGTTGSGKSVLFKLLTDECLSQKTCQFIIIDPSHEYGYVSPDGMPGLKQLHPNDITLFSVDGTGDKQFKINPENLTLIDLETILKSLSDVMKYALTSFNKVKGSKSLVQAIQDDASKITVHEGTLAALRSRLDAVLSHSFFDFEVKKDKDSLSEMKKAILNQHKSIVIDLGFYGTNPSVYFIIASLIARLFYGIYSTKKPDIEYPRLVMGIEEAHKFMEIPIFNNIAREMRKFQFILAIIDQIPASIKSEILSQLNNRFITKMVQEHDIDAALEGVDNAKNWKGTIKQFPMPRSLNPPKSYCFAYGSCISLPSVIEVLDFIQYIKDKPLNSSDVNQFDIDNDQDGVL